MVGVSPWQTAHELWLIKAERAPQPNVTVAMAHGTKLEPLAREAYEAQTGLVLQPLVLVDGEYSASLRTGLRSTVNSSASKSKHATRGATPSCGRA